MKHVHYNVLDPNMPPISDLLNELYQDTPGSIKRFTPRVDIYENDRQYGIILAIPGIHKGNIKIDIQDDKLNVSGERKLQMNEGIKYHMQETHFGVFSKIFHLPKGIDQEKIEATYEDGLLLILLPKSQKLKQKYQIEIK